LAQAQRAIGVNGIDRFVGSVGMVAQFKPEVLDKINTDEWADTYSEMLGVPPKLLVANEDAQVLREARNKAMAAKEQAEAQQQQSQTIKNVASAAADAPVDVMNMFSGYNNPAPQGI